MSQIQPIDQPLKHKTPLDPRVAVPLNAERTQLYDQAPPNPQTSEHCPPVRQNETK